MVMNIAMNLVTIVMSIFVLSYHSDDGIFYTLKSFYIRAALSFLYIVTTLYRCEEENVAFRRISILVIALLLLYNVFILVWVAIYEPAHRLFQ